MICLEYLFSVTHHMYQYNAVCQQLTSVQTNSQCPRGQIEVVPMTMTSTLIGRPAQKNWVLDKQSANTVESKQAAIQIPSLQGCDLIMRKKPELL